MRSREVPLRRSLLVRLLLLSALVSASSIAATAWLTVRSTAVAIRQEQGQTLADDASAYDSLLGYAATHADWSAVGPLVRQLAQRTSSRITLTDESRVPIADSSGTTAVGGPAPGLPSKALAVVDPLAVDTALASQPIPELHPRATPAPPSPEPCSAAGACQTAAATQALPQASPGSIDPRAVGPFVLPAAERTSLQATALATVTCLHRGLDTTATAVDSPTGRPVVQTSVLDVSSTSCADPALDQPTPTEARALVQLNGLVNACLARQDGPTVTVLLDLRWTQAAPRTPASDHLVDGCIDSSRKDQLRPYVAPPELLFVSNPSQGASTFLDLSSANRVRIAEVVTLALLAAISVSAVVGTRMVRPLRAVAGAARRMTDGDLTARVPISVGDEIGRVAAAFNAMAERREQLEGLRTAMVSDVAHELRTPLSTIRGWLEAAEDGLVVPDDRLLSSLLDETVLLQHVIDDLQDLALADAGELRLHPERIDVHDLLDQVAAAHRRSAEEAGITLLVAADGRPEAVADPVRLRQAVGNLVSNAVRHTPHGGQVVLTTRTHDRDVVIEVADTGTGIASGDLPHVFERFWRAERSRNRHTGGSGLGLAIVRKIVEAHGGAVGVTSVPGESTVFTTRLPAPPGDAGSRDHRA